MFTIRNFESKTLSWWYDQRNKIDFSPSYQRKGRLWSEKDKSFLIDSILNGFDMPKIYIADFTFFNSELNESRRPYAVVDGKQRFEAMFDFFSGKLTLAKDFVLIEEPHLKLGGLSLKDLRNNYPTIASKLENFNISVISIISDSDSLINEMFVRLNNSKPLTGAELRNAMKGVVPKLTREIGDHQFFQSRISFSVKRSQDTNVAAKLLLTEFRGKFVDTKKVQLDRFVQEAAAAESINLDPSYKNVIKTLDGMFEIFVDRDPLLRASGMVLLYYWLFKHVENADKKYLRKFLLEFDGLRKYNRRQQDILRGDNSIQKSPDINFVLFEKYVKTLNDPASLNGCYSILSGQWLNWIDRLKEAYSF